MRVEVSRSWNRPVQVAFWIVGIALGGMLAFTTRYFMGGDALPYIEMGEAFVTGEWCRLLNCCVGPVYPFFLGMGQILLHTNPLNEIPVLKAVNFVCFMVAMAACEAVLSFLQIDISRCRRHPLRPLPFPMVRVLCYGMFLVGAFSLIRLRLTNPDMLAYALVLFMVATVMWIRQDSSRYVRFVVLGLLLGVGYLTKTYIFVLSAVFVMLAGLCVNTLRKAVPRMVVALLIMLLIGAPYMTALSHRVGRPTIGLTGTHMYALHVSGKGSPIYPQVVHEVPSVLTYHWSIPCTRPAGFDLGYWVEGLWPHFSLSTQLNVFVSNVYRIFEANPWLLIILIYFALHAAFVGALHRGGLSPPSPFWIMTIICVTGLTLFSAIHIESRYLPPFLFLGFTALVSGIRYSPDDGRSRSMAMFGVGFLACLFAVLLTQSVIDQSLRGMRSSPGKPSYREAFLQEKAVYRFLKSSGLEKGHCVCVVGNPTFHWARMAGLTIIAEIPDVHTYLAVAPKERADAGHVLETSGIRALIAKDARLHDLEAEGWRRVPGTDHYFVLLLAPGSTTSEQAALGRGSTGPTCGRKG